MLTPTIILSPVESIAYKQTDAARILGVSERTLRTWKQDEKLVPINVEGIELYPRVLLEQFIHERLQKKGGSDGNAQ